MERVRGTHQLGRALREPVLTIGNFDGLHTGHRAIMERVVERATQRGGEAVVYTFDPHPRVILQPAQAPPMLMSLDQKLESLEEMGVDVAIVEPFDRKFASVSPKVFVEEFIHERIRPREVYVGYDFHFGRDREGSMRLLTDTGPRLGFSVTIVPEVTVGGRDVNSTRIRELVSKGEVEEAESLLGHPFAVRGEVVHGDHRGRELGFPTANIDSPNEVLPSPGVYTGQVRFLDGGEGSGSMHPAVTNVGVRPTFDRGQAVVIEAHLLDFEGDLYGRRIEFGFGERLRSEQRFDGVDELRAQIGRDLDEGRRRLGVG